MHTGPYLGGVGSAPLKIRTYHRPDSRGGGGSLPPESLPFPARGGARSGSGGWCPHSTPLGTWCTWPLYGRRPYIAWDQVWSVVTYTYGTAYSCAGPDNEHPVTPLPTPSRRLDTKISPSVAPKKVASLLSSTACTPSLISWQLFCRSITPSQTFSLRWSGGRTYQTVPSGRPGLLPLLIHGFVISKRTFATCEIPVSPSSMIFSLPLY